MSEYRIKTLERPSHEYPFLGKSQIEELRLAAAEMHGAIATKLPSTDGAQVL